MEAEEDFEEIRFLKEQTRGGMEGFTTGVADKGLDRSTRFEQSWFITVLSSTLFTEA